MGASKVRLIAYALGDLSIPFIIQVAPTPVAVVPHAQGITLPTRTQGNASVQQIQAPSVRQAAEPRKNITYIRENVLLDNLDAEIAHTAATVKDEVKGHSLSSLTEEDVAAPLDVNLTCPVCARAYRIGQIQRFRQHVDRCIQKEGVAIT